MDKDLFGEKWTEIKFDDKVDDKEFFLISNLGRIKNFRKDKINGVFAKESLISGFPCITVREKTGKYRGRYIHRLLAQTLIEKESEDQEFVIHLDYDKTNNKIWNLAWATHDQKIDHHRKDPVRSTIDYKIKNSKLTESQVKILKRKLLDPNRKTRYKILAKQFGVSDMQLTRIKRGENWGHITID